MQSRNAEQTATLTPAEQAVLNIISDHRALVKVIIDDEDLTFVLDQIFDPVKNRPSRSKHRFENDLGIALPQEVQKINMLTNKIHTHKPGQCRYTKHKNKDFLHTLKTSATLIPTEPQYMQVFNFDTCDIGFLWDIDSCLIKDKYIWNTNAATDALYWIGHIGYPPENDFKDYFCSLEKVREINKEAIAKKEIISWNELLVGLPKKRIDAVFTSQDNITKRLQAWNTMIVVKNKLGLTEDLPVLVMQAGKPHRIYTATEHEHDLRAMAKLKLSVPAMKKRERKHEEAPLHKKPLSQRIVAKLKSIAAVITSFANKVKSFFTNLLCCGHPTKTDDAVELAPVANTLSSTARMQRSGIKISKAATVMSAAPAPVMQTPNQGMLLREPMNGLERLTVVMPQRLRR